MIPEPNTSHHNSFLEFTSERMRGVSVGEDFMDWVAKYLVTHMKPMHVSIALYDSAKSTYPVKVSTGRRRIPLSLVALDRESLLVRWFQQEGLTPHFIRRSHRLITFQDFKVDPQPLSHLIMEEMKRHRVDVCAKIETPHRLAGYLLIGPREDEKPYTSEDLTFFQILANDIGVQIEKEEYYQLSHFDPLTGLLNRHSLPDKFQQMVRHVKILGGEFGVALIDIDNFKTINDKSGHLTGDQILRIVAEIIRSSVRRTDIAFRFGGDELLILFGMTSRDPSVMVIESKEFHSGIYQALDRIRRKISERPLNCLGQQVPVTVSIGLSFFAHDTVKNHEELIQEADQALYASKRYGKNLISVYPYL